MPCPACHELIVMFRGKTIGINRAIIENGTFDERRHHFAEIFAQCFENGIFNPGEFLRTLGMPPSQSSGEDRLGDAPESEAETTGAISEDEMERFVNIELHCLDDAEYFHKHFG